MVHGQKNIKLP